MTDKKEVDLNDLEAPQSVPSAPAMAIADAGQTYVIAPAVVLAAEGLQKPKMETLEIDSSGVPKKRKSVNADIIEKGPGHAIGKHT